MHMSDHCDLCLILDPRSSVIKATLVTCEKSIAHFDSIKHHRFSKGPPASSCSNTGPMRGGPYWISRENKVMALVLWPLMGGFFEGKLNLNKNT